MRAVEHYLYGPDTHQCLFSSVPIGSACCVSCFQFRDGCLLASVQHHRAVVPQEQLHSFVSFRIPQAQSSDRGKTSGMQLIGKHKPGHAVDTK
jgi:hypothetical protein